MIRWRHLADTVLPIIRTEKAPFSNISLIIFFINTSLTFFIF